MRTFSTYNKTNILHKIKPILFLTVLLTGTFFASAQNSISQNKSLNTSMQETIFLNVNTTTFLTGETLFYKLYSLNTTNNTPSLISKIAYIELVDNSKNSFQKNKVYLEKGIGSGEYFIPTTLKTGSYKIIAYTKWMLNNPKSQTHEIDIFIINPFQTQEPNENVTFDVTSKSTISTVQSSGSSILNDEKRVDFELDKESYYTRDKVNIKIKSLTETIEKGNYSLSIRKIDNIPTLKQLSPQEFITKRTNNYPNYNETSFIYIPELRSELITGTIVSKNNLPVNEKSLSLSLPGKEFVLKIVKTNAQGKFAFLLDKFPNFSNAIVQVLDDKSVDYTIVFDPFPKFDTSGLHFRSKLNLTPDLKKDIEERSTASQIQNAYYQIKKDSLATEAVINPFFNTIEKTYALDDYTRFPTLKESIVEVIIELYYRKENGKYKLRVRNDHKDLEIYGPPLVLVDGLLIQDPSDLFDYNMGNVDKVSLINEPYVYGPNLYGGMISFETKNSDFATTYAKKYLKTIEIQRPNPKKVYYNPDYSAGNNLKRIPDYRYQLLWEPNLFLDKKEDTLSFYTSDIKGDFEVILEGFTESGQPIYVSKTISVK
ncbi:hypothetical protein [Flavobacterium hydrophilum]|uniref:Macroglobulin domain-containing protein n=1 Tax=Flavobacterium hydrophilum TaxID=2211445 RepID=A0A2V4C297_9FLAO|nr:hypothetical protein [Flavobacterium hydrophilum]PXY45305.1 hypothetical protein DMB68_11520 [Flavobacterium hydrophilum]